MRTYDKGERGRGLGPFTGRQLTTICVAIIVMLMLPIGAWASGASSTSISDITGKNHALVVPDGSLSVSTALEPGTSYHSKKFVNSSTCQNVTPVVPVGKRLVVTSVAVYIEHGPAGQTANIELGMGNVSPNGPCGVQSDLLTASLPGPGSSEVFQIPSGIVFGPGRQVSMLINSLGTDEAEFSFVQVFGYIIPAIGACHVWTETLQPWGCF